MCGNPFSVPETIQKTVFRQPGCCPLLDAFCDFAKSTGSKVPIPLLPSDHQSQRYVTSLRRCPLERSERPHPNASPTASFPRALEESATSIHGVVSLGAPWRWLTTVSYSRITESLLLQAYLHGKIRPTLLGQPLDCTITLSKTPDFCCRCLCPLAGLVFEH